MRIFNGTNKKNKKQSTIAIMDETRDYVKNIVLKRLNVNMQSYKFNSLNPIFGSNNEIDTLMCLDKLEMADSYRGTVHCQEGDKFDEMTGVTEASNKAKKNFDRAVRKAFIRWQVAMINKIKAVSPDTFDEAVDKFNKQK